MNLSLSDFKDEGLYLIFPDLSRVILTRDNIQKVTKEYWENPEKISPQVKRLNLICKNDAFMNAFVNTQIVTTFLSMDIEKSLDKAYEEFEKKIA